MVDLMYENNSIRLDITNACIICVCYDAHLVFLTGFLLTIDFDRFSVDNIFLQWYVSLVGAVTIFCI